MTETKRGFTQANIATSESAGGETSSRAGN